MAEILVEDLSSEVVERLKAQAERHGRSLQGEVREILEVATGGEAELLESIEQIRTLTMREARENAEQWQRRLAGQMTSDSSDLLREDRER
jgi:plasmid stability protein